jgi:hypothetical protein
MKVKFLLLSFLGSCLFSSCSMYLQHFDCPPDPGVPCTSVTDLEKMIIETDEGPDIFLGKEPCYLSSILKSISSRKIWICQPKSKEGGYYIYYQTHNSNPNSVCLNNRILSQRTTQVKSC